MNDEDFARQAFAAAFRSGPTGEPPTLPDVKLLARHGRRANRNRHGLYAAGSTVLAGAAVAGIVTGPTLLGLGSPSSSDVGTGTQGAASTTPPASPATSSSSSPTDPAKPSPGVPCATPPAINWLSVMNGALPAGVTATADHASTCVQLADGSRTVEALFKLSTGTVELQVSVGTGPDIAAKAGAAAGMIGIAPAPDSPSGSLNPGSLTSPQASKMADAAAAAAMNSASAVGKPPASSPPAPDAAAIASLEAKKQAIASARATASPAPAAGTGDGIKGVDDQSCSKVAADENACVSHLTKGTLSVVDVQLMRTGGAPLIVDVAASNGKDASVPATGQLPSDATVVALAQAVAAHF
jgi:hypothetical protein